MPQEIPGGLTQVPGFFVGHASDFKNITGCTVILCPPCTLGVLISGAPRPGPVRSTPS